MLTLFLLFLIARLLEHGPAASDVEHVPAALSGVGY
jgi:hypothetical protein